MDRKGEAAAGSKKSIKEMREDDMPHDESAGLLG
jgi:hypothetical protein